VSIRAKFILFANLVVWSTGLGLIISTSLIYRTSLNDSFAQTRETELVKWQAICASSLAEKIPTFIPVYAQMLSMQPGVTGAYFLGLGQTEPAGSPIPATEDSIILSRPVLVMDKQEGQAVLGFSKAYQAKLVNRMLLIAFIKVLLVTVLLAAATILGGGLFADRIGRRLLVLKAAATEIEEGHFSVRIPPSTDELSFFTDYFNRVAERLATLDQRKDDFIASVSHDLRSPLQCITGYSRFIMDGVSGPVNEKQVRQLGIVLKSAAQLGSLVNTILDISKLEAEKLTLNLNPADIKQIATDVHNMLTVLAAKYELSLLLDVTEGLPQARVDAEQIQRVMTNLVTNALTLTPSGGSVTLRVAQDGPSALRVSVADTGPGIPPDKIRSMFTKFFQVEETKKAARKRGTGLGLTICKLLVEAHGGRIWVESEWQKGATFMFTIPLTEAPETTTPAPTTAAPTPP